MRRGAASVPGTAVDLTSGAMNLGLMGLDAITDMAGNPFGLDVPLRMPDKPIGGTEFNTDVIEAIMPGEPYQPEEMTRGQRAGYRMNEFGTAALLPGTVLSRVAQPRTITRRFGGERKATTDPRTLSRGPSGGPLPTSATPAVEPMLRPYRQGASPISDAVAGAGAGAGSFAWQEFVPPEMQEALGPIGEVISSLGGAVGANLLENVARTAGRTLAGTSKRVATGGVDTTLPANPDGSFVKSKDANKAAFYAQASAASPDAAAATIAERAERLRQYGPESAVPTTGALSGDPGLVALEKGFRQDPVGHRKFIPRDQATERAALDAAQNIAPETAVGRAFTEAVEAGHGQRVDLAERRVGWTERHQSEINKRQAAEALELGTASGTKPDASQRLDEVVAPTLTSAQGLRSAAYADLDPDKDLMRPVEPLLAAVDEIEAAVGPLSNPASLPADWISRVRAIADPEQGGTGEVSFADLNAARPELAGEIAAARKAQNFELADNLSAIRRVIDDEAGRIAAEGGEAGARAQRALDVEGEFSEVWRRGPGDEANRFRKDFNQDRQARSTTKPSQTASRFLRPGQPERAASLKRIIKDDPKGTAAAGDFLAADLAESSGVIRNGAVDPAAVRKWMSKWGDDAIGLSPEFRRQVDDLLQRADVNSNDSGVLARQLRDAQQQLLEARHDTDAIRRVLGNDPVHAVANILSSGDPERTIKEIVSSIDGNESARNGLKAAVKDYILERATNAGISRTGTGENPLSFARLDDLWKKHERVLAEVFEPEEMNSLRASHQFLAPLKNLEMRTLPGSPTSSNDRIWEHVAKPLEVALKVRYGILKGGGIMRTLNIWRQMLPNSDRAATELIERMMFDPELAKHLLTRDVSKVGSGTYNKRLIRLLSLGAGARELNDDKNGAPVDITVRGGAIPAARGELVAN